MSTRRSHGESRAPQRWIGPDIIEAFPVYTRSEFAADRVVHVVGLATAATGVEWLLSHLSPSADMAQVTAAWIYAAGLLAMLLASAAYNMAPPSPLKAMLRRLDRSAIFVMIAGSYTPFALGAMPERLGVPLCITIWFLAGVGITLVQTAPRIARFVSLPLYLAMGWLILGVLPALMKAVGGLPLILLVAGGIVYSLGAALQAHGRLLFHNAVWHAMVVVAAGLHFTAIVLLLPLAG